MHTGNGGVTTSMLFSEFVDDFTHLVCIPLKYQRHGKETSPYHKKSSIVTRDIISKRLNFCGERTRGPEPRALSTRKGPKCLTRIEPTEEDLDEERLEREDGYILNPEEFQLDPFDTGEG